MYILIGPSGAGKTTACEIIAAKSDIEVFDLDKILKEKIGGSLSSHLKQIGDVKFFELSKSIIEEIERKVHRDTIIVAGAGSINLDSSHTWYHQKCLISLTGDAEKLYIRGDRQANHPTLNSYVNTEFTPSRKRLYQNSMYCLDVTNKTPEDVAEELIAIIENPC